VTVVTVVTVVAAVTVVTVVAAVTVVTVVAAVTVVTLLTSLIYKLTSHYANKYLVRIFVCSFIKV